MANKYIIEGAAFNGDGTSSAEATVAGGVGAWNTITYFEGATPAYGSLAAGDVVYIRSKTAAGADITRTLTTTNISIGSPLATLGAPITWILDNGSVWPGVDGNLTYTKTDNGAISTVSHNIYRASRTHAISILCRHGSKSSATLIIDTYSVVDGFLFDLNAAMTYGSYVNFTGSTDGEGLLISPKFIVLKSNGTLIRGPTYGRCTVVNPDIEMLAVQGGSAIFDAAQYGGSLEVFGGRVHGVGATTGQALTNVTVDRVSIVGLEYPNSMSPAANTTFSQGLFLEVVGADGGAGTVVVERWGQFDSRNDGYYPTLNAIMPKSTPLPWSYKIYPEKTSRIKKMRMNFSKLYTAVPAQKTVHLEMLIANSFVGVDSSTLWVEVHYVDAATGLSKFVSTLAYGSDVGPLEVSSAPWSATTYGPVALLKRKFAVQTPTTIKQDTLVHVTLRGVVGSASANDIMFVCPDFYLT